MTRNPKTADAKLILLGAHFERLADEYRPLKAETRRLYQVYEAETADMPWDKATRKKQQAVMISTGYTAAYEASGAVHFQLVETMKQIYRHRPTTLGGFAAMASAIAFDTLDLELDPEPHQKAERRLMDLVKAMQAAAKMAGKGGVV